jgi:monoterpene epsilon-lactone hydrolase
LLLYNEKLNVDVDIETKGGEAEQLVDDFVKLEAQAKKWNVNVAVELWPGLPHVFHMFGDYVPQSRSAIQSIASFVQQQFNSTSKL